MANYCRDIALAGILHVTQNIVTIIQIIVPIILLISVAIKLFKAMMNPDEKKNIPRIRNSFIATAIVFFIPIILNVLINMADSTDSFINCWKDAKTINIKFQSDKYYGNEEEKTTLYVDQEYEKGVKNDSNTPSGNYSKNVESYMQAVKNTVDYARAHNYHYGDSHATPPTTDGLISCDRLEAKALWDIGYTDQRTGGEVVSTLDGYLTSHGWKKSTNINDVKYGSIVIVSHPGHNGRPTHAFTAVSYNPSNGVMVSYDEGSEWRVHAEQPFTSNYWTQSMIYGVYNME